MTSEHVGLAALLLTLAGILWKGGTLSGRIDAGLSELRAIIVELKAGLLEQQKHLPDRHARDAVHPATRRPHDAAAKARRGLRQDVFAP